MLRDGKVYLDSASTSFTPQVVIDEVNEYLANHQANCNRGANDLVFEITGKINAVRKSVAEFLHAEESQINFTGGATSSAQTTVYKCAINELRDGDEVMLCRLDHSSTINPWLEVCETLKLHNVNVEIRDIQIDIQGDYNEVDLLSKVNAKTKYIVLTHIHNVYGLEMGIKDLVRDIRAINPSVKIVLDASQSIGHIPVYVDELDVDYLYFSGHKVFSPTGVGVLYARGREELATGTPNILGIIGLGSAIGFINEVGLQIIEEKIYNLTRYLYDRLLEIDGIEFNKGIANCKCALGYGVISFKHSRVSSEEINEILNYYRIYVRSNNFCQESQDQYIRVSLHLYNDKTDIDKLIKVIKSVVEQ